MCRLFGMSGAPDRVRATFWLLDASDSLAAQSRRVPDGTGIGTFDAAGRPDVERHPVAAYQDAEFAREAREVESVTFIAHIRYASTGELAVRNTHPFEQHGRLFAHNGVIGDLPALEAELGPYRSLVRGETDSERFFALITKRIEEHGGDVGAGIAAAARWTAEHLPLYAVNLVLTTPTELWALRYPETHDLLVLERQAGGPSGSRHLEQAGAGGTVRVRSGDLAGTTAVVVATEAMDDNPDWRPLGSGELLHVGPDLTVTRTVVLDAPPARLLRLDQLSPRAAASQLPAPPA